MSKHQSKLRSELTVTGYIRQIIQPLLSQKCPLDIIHLLQTFYVPKYTILRFHHKWKSADRQVALNDDHTCATRWNGSGHVYALIDDEPVMKGQHCWRIQVKNSLNKWLMFAIGELKEYDDRSFKKVYGVSTWSQWFPWYPNKGENTNDAKTEPWKDKEDYQMDMLFDADIGCLKVCNVSENETSRVEAIIEQIPTETKGHKGFVPNFNFYASGASMRVAKIPCEWYTEPRDIDFPL